MTTTVRSGDLFRAGYGGRTIEFRRAAGNDVSPPRLEDRMIMGYAAVFNTDSRNLGGFVERVHPHAFNRDAGSGFRGPDGIGGVLARWNHEDDHLIGTTRAGTLKLRVDSLGLMYVIKPPESRRDISELVERGDVSQSSFAFRVREETWGSAHNGFPVRTLMDVELIDVAPVNMPAYPDTTVAYNSLAVMLDMSPREARELALRGEMGAILKRHIGGPRRRVASLRTQDAGRTTGHAAQRRLERRAA